MLLASAITGLSLSDVTVQSGVTYYYVVTAIDSAGEESPNSNEAKAVIP
jgi:fibronectin type 3 domain-containing protein